MKASLIATHNCDIVEPCSRKTHQHYCLCNCHCMHHMSHDTHSRRDGLPHTAAPAISNCWTTTDTIENHAPRRHKTARHPSHHHSTVPQQSETMWEHQVGYCPHSCCMFLHRYGRPDGPHDRSFVAKQVAVGATCSLVPSICGSQRRFRRKSLHTGRCTSHTYLHTSSTLCYQLHSEHLGDQRFPVGPCK